jgi:hypothetical protein
MTVAAAVSRGPKPQGPAHGPGLVRGRRPEDRRTREDRCHQASPSALNGAYQGRSPSSGARTTRATSTSDSRRNMSVTSAAHCASCSSATTVAPPPRCRSRRGQDHRADTAAAFDNPRSAAVHHLVAHEDQPGRAHRPGAPGQIVSLVEYRPENLPGVHILSLARIVGEPDHAAPSGLVECCTDFVVPVLDIRDRRQLHAEPMAVPHPCDGPVVTLRCASVTCTVERSSTSPVVRSVRRINLAGNWSAASCEIDRELFMNTGFRGRRCRGRERRTATVTSPGRRDG